MSILETPRVYFKGEIAWDPITTNNYPKFYDEINDETVFFDVTTPKVKGFRQAAVTAVTTGNWNPHGTHRVTFYDTAVSGCDLGAGTYTADPFIEACVNFEGMLVDLEPYGAYSSQLYFNKMLFGVDGGYSIILPRTYHVTDRYINFSRNRANAMIAGIASVVWQTSFAKEDGLAIEAFDSPILQKLAQAIEEEDVLGLTVRFDAYRTIYYNNPDLTNGSPLAQQAAATLQKQLQEGGFQPNPARSLVVGTIGLWRAGEPPHEPGDRMLASLSSLNSHLASAHARVSEKTVTLDLSNSVSEIDKNLTKQDLGTLSLIAVDADGNTVTKLGYLPYASYNRAAYEASAGIVTIPLLEVDPEVLATNDLQLVQADGTVLLTELPLRALPTTPNLYRDQEIGGVTTTTFQVYDRGQPAAEGITVNIYPISADGGSITGAPVPVTTDANGVITYDVQISDPGVSAFVPSCYPTDVPVQCQGIDTQVNPYMYVRVHPADADIATLSPTWDNVYCKVLSNWNAMAPCMDNWLRLDDPKQIKAYASVLKRLTDPANFEDFRFMPVTRDMTPGQRALLYAFLDAPTEVPEEKQAEEKEKTNTPRPVSISRAMRNPHL